MLGFHLQCVHELTTHPSGALIVLGKGLGDWRILCHVLRVGCKGHELILVLNAHSDHELIREASERLGFADTLVHPLDAQIPAPKRAQMYASGGCLFATTRVLVTDLLKDVIKRQVLAVVVVKAHLVTEQSNEAFAIRMIKEKSPNCKVWSLTDSPDKLSNGYAKLSQVMGNLCTQTISLFPRFRVEVKACLDPNESNTLVKVTEIRQPLSDRMREIQSALVGAIGSCVDEIRRSASVDVSDLTVDSTMFRSFDKVLQYRLTPIWQSVSPKVKRLISDLRALRQLLGQLLNLDCVSFYEILLDIRRASAESPDDRSPWLMSLNGDRIFKGARARLYTIEKEKPTSKEAGTLRVALEPHLKIHVLRSIFDEIKIEEDVRTDTKEGRADLVYMESRGGSEIVVLVRDDHTLVQVVSQLSQPGNTVVEKRFYNYLGKLLVPGTVPSAESELLRMEFERMTEARHASYAPKMDGPFTGQVLHLKDPDPDGSLRPSNFFQSNNPANFTKRHSQIAVHTMSELAGGILEHLLPRFVIVYDPDIAAMREVECFNATHSWLKVHLYMMYLENSLEEQRHYSNLNHERDAFLRLVEEKSSLVFVKQDLPKAMPATTFAAGITATTTSPDMEDDEAAPTFFDAATGQSITKKPRILARGKAPAARLKVIVDGREMRSFLPNMLHKSGFLLDLRVIEVGDYILSRDVCVERKAINDLIESFKSGRLFTQVTMMSRHYKKPVLLIEFPEDGPFRFQADTTSAEGSLQSSLMGKLVLLALHFPDLRIIWSKSLRSTVDVFRELQRNELPPDGDAAEAIERNTAGTTEVAAEATNIDAIEVLKKLPGVNKENMYRLARGAGSLARICDMDLATLQGLCESASNGRHLYEFLHSV